MYPPANSDTEKKNTRRQNMICSETSSTQYERMNGTETHAGTHQRSSAVTLAH